MPLLQESQTSRDIMLSPCETKIKSETEDNLRMSTAALSAFPSLHHTNSLLTQNHLWVNNAVRQAAFMSASGFPVNLHATLSSNPGLFSPAIFGTVWPTSPQSPPSGPGSPISPTSKARKNNNNNVVSSSSGDIHQKTGRRKAPRKGQETVAISNLTEKSANISDVSPTIGPLSPPTSGSSPPSSTGELSSAGKEPARDKQFTCGVCNRSFGYKHVLQNHERTHTGEKPFECPQCHKRFTRDHHLKTHMRLHTGERPYHCNHCDRHFVQVANLRRHLRVHTGERPYQCQQCSARFSDTNQLKAHALIHKGEKPYECERCHGRFRRKHHLMHHKCGMMPVVSPRITALAGLDSPDGIDTATTLTTSSTSSTSNISTLHPSPRSQKILSPVPNSDIGSDDDTEHPTDLSGSSEKIRERKSRDIRRVIRRPNVSPIITLPLHVALPEQTEPEDLSMSTGQHHHHSHSHSSGDSSLSRSPSLDIRDDEEEDDEPDETASLFLRQQTIVQQRNY